MLSCHLTFSFIIFFRPHLSVFRFLLRRHRTPTSQKAKNLVIFFTVLEKEQYSVLLCSAGTERRSRTAYFVIFSFSSGFFFLQQKSIRRPRFIKFSLSSIFCSLNSFSFFKSGCKNKSDFVRFVSFNYFSFPQSLPPFGG